jgi:hypothetical protein
MKIKKTLFTTEIEIYPHEIRDLKDDCTFGEWYGLFRWIRKTFGLDLIKIYKLEK